MSGPPGLMAWEHLGNELIALLRPEIHHEAVGKRCGPSGSGGAEESRICRPCPSSRAL